MNFYDPVLETKSKVAANDALEIVVSVTAGG